MATTPAPDDRTAAVAAAQGLTAALEAVDGRLSHLTTYGRVNRALIYLVAACVVAIVVLGVFVARNASAAHAAANKARVATSAAEQEHQSQVTGCVAGNAFRSSTTALWQHVTEAVPLTAAQRAAVLQIVGKADKLRDCATSYPNPLPPK